MIDLRKNLMNILLQSFFKLWVNCLTASLCSEFSLCLPYSIKKDPT